MEDLSLALLFVLPCVMAAAWDVKILAIPNFVVLWLGLGFAVHGVAFGASWYELGAHVLVGAIVLALGLIPYAFGQIGGGDIKLVAAGALWFGWPEVLIFALATAVAGGLLAAAVYGIRQFDGAKRRLAGFLPWIAAEQPHIPYGLAIAVGALFGSSRVLA